MVGTTWCLSPKSRTTPVFWNFMQSRHLWQPLWSLVTPDMVFVQAHVVHERQVCAYFLRQDIFVELENLGSYDPTSFGESPSHFLLVSC